MASNIEHQGIVEKVTPTHVTVRLVQTSACGSCAARGSCAAADSREHLLDIIFEHSTLSVGDTVTVVGSTSNGLKAAFLAGGIPAIMITVISGIVSDLTDSDWVVAGVVLGFVVFWYFILYLMRHKLAKKLTFYIKP